MAINNHCLGEFWERIGDVLKAVLSGISFRTYISDGWNKLDCTALFLFIIGFCLRVTKLIRMDPHELEAEAYHIVNDVMLDISRICLAISLFTFYIRLMYTFSFHIALGPKLIMIGKMVTNDLIPFMIILTVISVGYAVASHSIAYPNGIYTNDSMKNEFTVHQKTISEILFTMYKQAYFQMFGDFGLDNLQGVDDECDKQRCPTKTARWLVPIMLGVYVLLTNILMFNLLIAMFSKTYEEIESASTYYWNYQRYQMIAEYVHRSPLVPPLIIIWHMIEAYQAIGNGCASIRTGESVKENPFWIIS
ncbi:Transient receptor putative cation channel subfamily M member 2 [Cichlidogyrus casuarinus]|uniref:Transient receptor putative cation channel subfamily M member 2 n=1 Tax=Cichlidogyrus casuarinus TaxID=1844966 RepID=A0ABD2Q678_9PLAT